MKFEKSCAAAFFLVSGSLAAPVLAQDTVEDNSATEGDRLKEIVVTAQKRAENVQDIPLAITAVDGELLRDRQVTSVDSLSTVAPSLNFGNYGGAARIAIRGIGFDIAVPGAEGRIAYHLDGVYVSRPSAQMGTFYDIDRVEVLRGPQGTLYGRNATGGSINVITRAPTAEPSGYADITVGNYGRVAIETALSGQITEGILGRIAVMSNNRSGYGKNEFTGNDIDDANQRGGRITLRMEPTADLGIDLAADYYSENDSAYTYHYFGPYNPSLPLVGVRLGGRTANNVRNINSEFDPTNNREAYGISATVSKEFGGATVRSISAYRHSSSRVETDLDITELRLALFPFYEKADQYSQELQISGSSESIEWLVGGYYFNEHTFGGVRVPRNLLVTGGPDRLTNGLVIQGNIRTQAKALFGQLDWSVTDNMKLTLGARYNNEQIKINDVFSLDYVNSYTPDAPLVPFPGFPRRASTTSNAFTPKIGLTYDLNDDALLYATVSKGFKSGGFNLAINVPAFKPESIWAYEAGFKLTTVDRRLRMNLAGFYYDYANLQVTKIVLNQAITENAAAAELYGGELEFTILPTSDFQFDGSISYLHSQYKDYTSLDPVRPQLGVLDLEGNHLIQAPKLTVNTGAQVSKQIGSGEFLLRGEMNYMSRIYFTAFNVDSVSQEANVKFNAFLNWTHDDGHWKASLFVRNIANKITKTSGLVASATYGSPITGSISPPRTIGATIGYSF